VYPAISGRTGRTESRQSNSPAKAGLIDTESGGAASRYTSTVAGITIVDIAERNRRTGIDRRLPIPIAQRVFVAILRYQRITAIVLINL
jgi:hypothetical protein